ncbi:MAG: flavodoxin domain-containing protein [bacterium]|nr:flavodoxin domain-containing protein [bacterium]
MSKRILIAYASRVGSTAEVAEKIGEVLRNLGLDVEVRSIKDVTSISNYDGIIIGSAVRMFKLLPETMKFVNRFREEIRNKPVAYFIVCLTMQKDVEESRTRSKEYLKPLLEIKEPISIGFFGGKMDYSKLSFIWRILFKGKVPEGDFRDWKKITDWAGDLFVYFSRS